ncbi:hypothetical protein GE09DRAFT_675733 [Coniochaeta sp. 2T2.1]|nr:hypothetical protein GE09DRAFT_675733 [Coniochaeta sp. 2T2.1]
MNFLTAVCLSCVFVSCSLSPSLGLSYHSYRQNIVISQESQVAVGRLCFRRYNLCIESSPATTETMNPPHHQLLTLPGDPAAAAHSPRQAGKLCHRRGPQLLVPNKSKQSIVALQLPASRSASVVHRPVLLRELRLTTGGLTHRSLQLCPLELHQPGHHPGLGWDQERQRLDDQHVDRLPHHRV